MLEFDVVGMSCGSCVGRVTRAIQAIDPRAKVEVDLPKGKVKVDSTAGEPELKEALDEAGYPVLNTVTRPAPARG